MVYTHTYVYTSICIKRTYYRHLTLGKCKQAVFVMLLRSGLSLEQRISRKDRLAGGDGGKVGESTNPLKPTDTSRSPGAWAGTHKHGTGTARVFIASYLDKMGVLQGKLLPSVMTINAHLI